MLWSEIPVTICTPKSLPNDYFKKYNQDKIKKTFDSNVSLDNFDKLIQSRTCLSKQSEIREIDGLDNNFNYWKVVEQVTSFVKDKHYLISLITFEYGIVSFTDGKLIEDKESKIFFQIQIPDYDIVKNGYFTEVHLNMDKTCIALVSQTSCCVCHLPELEYEPTTTVYSKEFGNVSIVENAYTGYLLRDVHLEDYDSFSFINDKKFNHKISRHVIKVKWHQKFNNFICILEKNSNKKDVDLQTYFRIYNISKNIDVPVYRLKIDSSAWKNIFYRTNDFKESDTIYNVCYGDEGDLSFDTNVKLDYENSGNIVDFTMGIHDPDDVWQGYTLYLLHELGFIYIYTPIIFFDLKLSETERIRMSANTTYHLLNSNSVSSENLSSDLYTDLNLLLYNSSESIHTPRLICANYSQGQETCTSFTILSYSPIFIFAIINSVGTLSIYTSDFSLFPYIYALSNSWSQSIDAICIYTINYSVLNPLLFPIGDNQESILVYSTKSYYFLQLNMSTGDGSKIISSKNYNYMKNRNVDNIIELTYGGCNIRLFNSLLAKSNNGCSIYSHPCYIHANGEINVFVNEYPIQCRFMRPIGFCVLKVVLERRGEEALSTAFIRGEIETFRRDFTSVLGKIRGEMAKKDSMVSKTFNVLTLLQSLHRIINKFNEVEKFYSCLLEKVKETHESNVKNTLELINSSDEYAADVNVLLQERIDKIRRNNDIIQSKFRSIDNVFSQLSVKRQCQNVQVYYNNFITRIDCVLAEFIHLYLQYQCIECIKIRVRSRGYETVKDKPVLSVLGPAVTALEHILSSSSYCDNTSTSFMRNYPRSSSRDPPRSSVSQLSRSQVSHSQVSRMEAMEIKWAGEERNPELNCENCTMLKDAFKKYVMRINNINRGLNRAV